MRTFIALACLLSFSAVAQGKAKAPEIDTVILMQTPNGYTLQYSEAGRDDSGAPVIRSGDQVPILTDADKKTVKPLFDLESARARPAVVGSLVLGTDTRGAFFIQHTATRTQQGRTSQVIGPLTELTSDKDKKNAQAVFGLAKRARTGK